MAQSASLQMGARAQGMGYASACLSDVWSMTHNVAGLAKTDHAAAAFSYHAIPSLKFLNRMSAVFALPVKTGAAGASLFRFGDDLYNEQVLSLGFANTFGLASLGLKANYIQYRAEGRPARGAFTLSFGGMARLTPQLSFGAHIVNLNQPVIDGQTGERIPTRLLAGLSAQPSDNLILSGEIEKDLHHAATVKSGLEYRAFKKLAFRTGFNLHPEAGFFGLGFKTRTLYLDYALQYNHALGLSHQASVTVQLDKS